MLLKDTMLETSTQTTTATTATTIAATTIPPLTAAQAKALLPMGAEEGKSNLG